MKILQRQKVAYEIVCGGCLTVLELDESDFTAHEECIGNTRVIVERVLQPCPVCGRSFKHMAKVEFRRKVVPIEENVEVES